MQARRILKKPIEVSVGGRSVVSDTIEQNAVVLEDDYKFRKLLELLGLYQQKGQVLVFVNKQDTADLILKDVMSVGYPCLTLHGGIDQQDRDSNIKDFRQGNIRLLVATSVAARGLDVKSLCLVVNYDCPNHYEDYVHRVGRTGRAGAKGTAWTFITPDQKSWAGDVIKAFELQGNKAPDDVEALWKKYKDERKKAGKKLMLTGGFGGSGFKFDDSEADAQGKKRAQQAKKHGMETEGGAVEDEDDIFNNDEEIKNELDDKVARLMGKSKMPEPEPEANAPDAAAPLALMAAGQTALLAPPALLGAGLVPPPLLGAAPNATAPALAAPVSAGALKAQELAAKLAVAKGIAPAPAAAAAAPITSAMEQLQSKSNSSNAISDIFQGKNALGANKAALAASRAMALNQKFGFKTRAGPMPNAPKVEEPVIEEGAFEAEVEINDFPSEARFKMTRREHIEELSAITECAITSRGTFYPLGKKAKTGDKKLYLFIEGKTQASIDTCKTMIERILREELHTEATSYSARGRANPGRYNVMAIGNGSASNRQSLTYR